MRQLHPARDNDRACCLFAVGVLTGMAAARPAAAGALGVGSVVVGYDHRIRMADRAAARSAGEGAALVGRRCHEVFHGRPDPCDPSEVRCPLRELSAAAGGAAHRCLHIHRGPGGDCLVEVVAVALEGDGGEEAGVLLTFTPAGAVPANRAMVDRATEGLMAFDAAGRLVSVNRRWCELFGVAPEAAMGRRFSDFVAQGDRPRCEAGFAQVAAGETHECAEIMGLRPDGTTFSARVNLGPAEGAGGVAGAGSVREISDELAMQASLRAAARFRRALLDGLGEGVVVIDRGYRILEANAGYCRALGLAPGSAAGRSCYEVSHGSEVPCWQLGPDHDCPVREAFENGRPASAVHRHRDAAGRTRYMEVRAIPLRDEAGLVSQVIETHTDVTEKMELENRLAAAQRMEALGTLAGGVAHDLNNVLMPIMGNVQIALMKLPADEPLRKNLEDVLRAAERAADLIRRILAFCRRQVIEKRRVDLNEVVRGLETLLRRLIREDVVLETVLADDLRAVSADPGQIEQVLVNLAVNARDAMPEGGTLLIETQNADRVDSVCSTCGERIRGPHVLLMVSDSGTGMDAETLSHIFEPFFTTKGPGQGTGLG
ncbi:PAS domain-containing protein, partial [Dissulfurirhabdus thermomarina]